MQSTNEEVPTVSLKTTATMHDYFKPADAKKAADVKRGLCLKKRKSIANESIDLDRQGKPSKSHCHDADCSARGLAPKPKDTTLSTSVATKTSTVAVSAPPPTKNKRTHHTVNGAMANAVEEWFCIKDALNAPSKAAVARQKQLKPDTLKKYVHDVPEKRRKLGCHAGRPSLLSKSNSQFLMQHTIQAGRANNGLTPAQIIENMTTLQPKLSQLQSRNHYPHTFIKKHANRLKQKPVKAQKTTSKQSQCTVAQQFRWFKLYEKALCFLRTKNTGVCNKTGKSFGDLINHFILGGDETNLIADADGELRIVGEKGKKKHEKKVSNYRGSITMYRTGVAAGHNGPTVFLLKGKNRKSGFNNTFQSRRLVSLDQQYA
jgi:hypothetical protein